MFGQRYSASHRENAPAAAKVAAAAAAAEADAEIMSNPGYHDTVGAPALSQELGKAEARQASNLRVTTKAIDALHARIAKAKQVLDNQQQSASPAAVGSPSRSGARAAASGKSPARSPTKSPTKSPAAKSPSKGKGSASKSSPASRKSTAKSSAAAAGGGAGPPQAMELEGGEMDGGGGGGGGDTTAGGVLAELASDVAGLKTLEAVGSENKNFHATISKLAKAAEKVKVIDGFEEKQRITSYYVQFVL